MTVISQSLSKQEDGMAFGTDHYDATSDPATVKANQRRSWAGSGIGGIAETQQMLDFCAEHGLGATIETIGGEDIDAAWDRVVASDVRYRFVIDTSTF